jgi:predicted ATPase/DNA-binding SARP family transcriptional activator
VRISLLGPVEVRQDDGTLIDLGGTRLRTLFIRLALDPGRTVSNDMLVDAVWENEPPTNAPNALQQLVSRLRRRGVPIQADPTGYRLEVEPADIDIFGDGAGGPWRGPVLADVADRSFAAPHITRLTELRASAEEETATGIPELEALVIKYPLRERPVELLMRALWTQGRPAEALTVYEKYRRDVADELGADPSASLGRLHVEILQGTEPATQHLPLSLTSFIGRETDVAKVKQLLAKNRLVTLTGPGGSGKTRLAIESGRSLAEVRLVELAPLTESGQIAPAILASLGIREHLLLKQFGQQGEPHERVVSALRSQHAVVILDNCEHLLDGTARLASAILTACPQVKILATSREPLGIIGEALWTVEPLQELDAITLLRERAEASRPGFAADREILARLTQALDGMPLAIELAAARLRSMPIEQLYQRIDERFRLLTAGSRTALPRHQTLRAVVDWSWDLCTVDERDMWRCLAVFHGGANLEALQAVYGPNAWEVINALAEKSLVRVDGDRYSMLETIREYALEKSGDTDYALQHAEYFASLAERAEPYLRTDQQIEWLKVLRADHDNLDAALRDRVTAGDVTMATRLVAALGWYWWLGGYRAEGSRLAIDVLEMPDPEPDDATRARAFAISAINILDGHGDIPRALEWYTEAAEITKRVGPVHPMLKLAPPMALLVNWAVDGGSQMVEAYENLFDDDDLWVVATAHTFHAHGLVNMGRPGHEVRHEFELALSGYRKIGDRWGMALALEALSVTAAQRGDFAASAAQAWEAIGLLSKLGTSEDLLQLRMRLAQALWMDGKKAEAITTLEEAQLLADQLGAPYPRASMDVMWAILERVQGDQPKAWKHLNKASATIAGAVVAPQFWAFLAHTKGLLAAEEGRLELARQEHTAAIEHALASSDYPIIGIILVGCADLVLREGDPVLAARFLGASEAMSGCIDHSIMDLPRVTESVRNALPADTFAAAYRLGQTATVENLPALVAGESTA